MSEKRTTASHWVYRIALGLLILGTLRYGQFIYHQAQPALFGLDGLRYWITVSAFSGQFLTLCVVVLAMVLRSGAVVWLIALQFGTTVITLSPTMFMSGSVALPASFAAATLTLIALGIATFTFLIRREEIRRP